MAAPFPRGKTQCLPLIWPGSSGQLCTAVHLPSSRKSKLTLSKQEPIPWAWAGPAATNTDRHEGHQTLYLSPPLDPWFHQTHCSSIELERLPRRQNCKKSTDTPSFTAHERWVSLVILWGKNELSFFSTFFFFLPLFSNIGGRGWEDLEIHCIFN